MQDLLFWLLSNHWGFSWWQILLFTLLTTHITIAAVTIFLHRAQAHRALELHAIPAHFFRFWLWLTTGMVTKEFVAVHRKHHAKCETVDDPHSPQTRGLRALLLTGVELYRKEAANPDTIAEYGHGTPDDWIERHVYSKLLWQGVGLMLTIDLILFGAIGATVWAVQMVWIPWWATGVINGLGHYFGYRNFDPIPADKSQNIVPWGILIGGEELHNNHHTYPTSAKFSVKPFEFDIGWWYIRAMVLCGFARVKHSYPRLRLDPRKAECDEVTVEAVIGLRHQLLAWFDRRIKKRGIGYWEWVELRDFRKRLEQSWQQADVKREEVVAALKEWCHDAERTGIPALQKLARRIPRYTLKSR